jgi:hypothetical protein
VRNQRRRNQTSLWTAFLTAALGALVTAAAASATVTSSAGSTRSARQAADTTSTTTSTLPPVRHVFIIVLENELESVTFGSSASKDPYLSQTLPSMGAFVPKYYGIGHNSLDNYIAMIGGQPPNPTTQADCPTWQNMSTDTMGSYGAVEGSGCIYPADTPTVANQLTSAGFSWGAYMDEMGLDPSREAASCPVPVVGQTDNTEGAESTAPYDEYAERHDPFMYYDSITSNLADCQQHVVNLSKLPTALQSASTTPNYVFITPDLCNDGHNTAPSCGPGEPGGLPQINSFLSTWVPQILNSPAYQQNGLLLVTFDEGEGDSSSCCGEIAGPGAASPGGNGPGGGDVGAVMLSPFIKPGTVSQTAYNHYTMLGSVEDLFGLQHLGYAQLPGETDFGSDIYTNYDSTTCSATAFACGLPENSVKAPALASTAGTTAKIKLTLSATASSGNTIRSEEVDDENLSTASPTWASVSSGAFGPVATYIGTPGDTYEFRMAATDTSGDTGQFATATTVVPSGVKPSRGRYKGAWKQVKRAHAWLGRAIQSSRPGASFSLRYTGGNLTLIGEKGPKNGKLKVTIGGKSRTINTHAAKAKYDQTLATFKVKTGRNTIKLKVVSGTAAIEGYGIVSRTA